MCTALSLKTENAYFGRTLDLDRSYGEEVCITPRNSPLIFRKLDTVYRHYAIIGMATVVGGTPLYYDAANECGLGMAGLNFPENAEYASICDGLSNVAPFEFIPWILGQCKDINEVRTLLSVVNIVNTAFSDKLPNSPLHWIISDGEESITVESMRDGLHIYDNPIGILTNNPPFPYQLEALRAYEGLRTDNSKIKRNTGLHYSDYCQGLGALGLPGDLSSMSRFARIAFAKKNSVCRGDEISSVSQFFHLLSFVEMTRGLCMTDEGTLDITGYTSCIDLTRGRYYYTTYSNRRISCVDMHGADIDLDADEPTNFKLRSEESIFYHGR